MPFFVELYHTHIAIIAVELRLPDRQTVITGWQPLQQYSIEFHVFVFERREAPAGQAMGAYSVPLLGADALDQGRRAAIERHCSGQLSRARARLEGWARPSVQLRLAEAQLDQHLTLRGLELGVAISAAGAPSGPLHIRTT